MKIIACRNLLRCEQGSTIVEFAIIGPAMLTMMFGILQVGMTMQSYNAMRSLASESARQAVVNYQSGNRLSNTQLETMVRTTGITPPYSLDNDRLQARVINSANQRVQGAVELTLTINYRSPTVLSIIGIDDIPLSFTRPIFVSS